MPAPSMLRPPRESALTHGSICRGKAANVFITKPISSYAFCPTPSASNRIETIIFNGQVYQPGGEVPAAATFRIDTLIYEMSG